MAIVTDPLTESVGLCHCQQKYAIQDLHIKQVYVSSIPRHCISTAMHDGIRNLPPGILGTWNLPWGRFWALLKSTGYKMKGV